MVAGKHGGFTLLSVWMCEEEHTFQIHCFASVLCDLFEFIECVICNGGQFNMQTSSGSIPRIGF